MSILCYHSVESGWKSPLAIPPEQFDAQCTWLTRHRRVIDLTRALDHIDRHGRLPWRGVTLTFDDGFAGFVQHALPVLTSHSMPAAAFIVAATLTGEGQRVDWVDTPPPWPMTTMSKDEVLEAQDAGVTIGSHSWAHRDLTTLSESECRQDLIDSRDLLQEVTGRRVRVLAYPRGRHAPHVRRAALGAGFTHALSLPETSESSGPFAVPRVGIYPDNSAFALAVKTTPGYLRLRLSPVFPALRRIVAS